MDTPATRTRAEAGSWSPKRLIDDTPPPLWFIIVTVSAYAALTAFLAAHHEPWRDEADSWLFVRDCGLATIIARTRYTGHPALWYVCLAPLPRLGFTYVSQKVLHLVFAVAAAGLFLSLAPLSRLTKTLAVLSYFFVYEYAVIVRDYALTVFLIFAAAALFSGRRERPISFALILFLLFSASAQGFIVASAFAAVFIVEHLQERSFRARDIAGGCIMVAGAIVSWLQVRTPADPARQGVPHFAFNPRALAASISAAFLPSMPVVAGLVAGVVVLALVTIAIRHSRRAVALLWLSFGALIILYSYIYYGGVRHAGFFLVVTIISVWIAAGSVDARYAAPAAVALNVILAISVVIAAVFAIAETRWDSSGSKEMARVIQRNGLDRYEIAAHNLTQAEAVLPYFAHKKFWYAGLGRYGTYMTWDAAMERALDVPYPVAERRAREHFEGKPWLLLFTVEMPDPAAHGFRLLYTNHDFIFDNRDERYWLYAPLNWPGPPIGAVR